MASEYTPNRRYPLYTDSDKPNLRDQYNGAIREIDTDMAQSLQDSSVVAAGMGAGFDAQHTVRMAIDDMTQQLAQKASSSQLNTLGGLLPSSSFSSSNTVKHYIDSGLAALDTRLDTLESKKHLIAIGDSFTHTGYGLTDSQMWWYRAARVLGCTPHSYGVNGTGFVQGMSAGTDFNSQLSAASSDSSFDNDDVAYVIVMGGINDTRADDLHEGTNYMVRVRNLLVRAQTLFPNAEVIMCGCNTFDTISYVGLEGAAGTYNYSPLQIADYECGGAETAGVRFVNITSLLVGATGMFGDASAGHHPNAYGQNALCSALLSGRGAPISMPTFTAIQGTGSASASKAPNGINVFFNVTATVEYNANYQMALFSDNAGALQFCGHNFANKFITNPVCVGMGHCVDDYSAEVFAQIIENPNSAKHGALRILVNRSASSRVTVNVPLMM